MILRQGLHRCTITRSASSHIANSWTVLCEILLPNGEWKWYDRRWFAKLEEAEQFARDEVRWDENVCRD